MTGSASITLHARSSRRFARWATAAFGILLTTAVSAAPADDIDAVQNLVSRVGPVIGSASVCPGIGLSQIQNVTEKFRAVIKVVPNEADRENLTQQFDRYAAFGRNAVTTGKITCETAELQFKNMEQVVSAAAPVPSNVPSTPSRAMTVPAAAIAPPAPAAIAPVPVPVAQPVSSPDREIRFGMVAPFTGYSRDIGRQMEIGITAAFNRINDAGGVNGRMLRLIPADDGYDPTRTLAAMKQLYEKERVFAFIGNYGTATGAVAMPYLLENRVLFFGPFSGGNIFRKNPPDRYVFNYRASYDEEMDATVRYLLKVRHLQPKQIAVFAQDDAYGDAGFTGVAKSFRSLGLSDAGILRVNYKRNTIDVDPAVNTLRAQKPPIKAVIMVATYRAAARFIEKTRDLFPDMIYTNTSLVGSTQLANELMLLGPRLAPGIIVTQVLPAVGGNSSEVLEYKDALAKYFPTESAADYISFEAYITANVLIEGLKRAGPDPDTEKLVSTLEDMRNLDLGLGRPLNFGRAEHQASHEVWGTVINGDGKYEPLDLK